MKFVPQGVSLAVGRQMLTAKQNSPHIFFVGGVVGLLGSTFLACRATLKLEETLDDIHAEIKEVKKTEEPKIAHSEVSEHEHFKDVMYVYSKSAARMVRLYGPSVAVGAISIAALTGSHVQLTRRNTALTASFAALSKAFDEYRVRIQEEIGVEKERDIYLGVEDQVAEENGKKVTAKAVNGAGYSIYARMFEESNPNWEKDPEMSKIFLTCQQNYFNHQLQVRGHVFLNEVYDALGLERSHAGQVVGWLLKGDGDGHIDFGMYDVRAKDFLNGTERNIILDFNVDGVIHHHEVF